MKIDEIYFIDRNNKPEPRTIIENRTFDHNGYRIIHFSMGAGTAGSPERYHHLGIYTCNKGCVHLEIHHKDRSIETITLHRGEFWIRPCHTLLGWYVEEDTIFTILNLRYQANFVEEAKIGGICSINNIPDAPENECIVKRILDDPLMKLDFVQMGTNGKYDIPEDRNVIFAIEKGKCTLTYRDKKREMQENQSFHSFQHGRVMIQASEVSHIIMLTIAES